MTAAPSAPHGEGARLTAPSRLRVIDLGTGMAAALVAKLFADAGGCVERLAPDGDAAFDAVYPAHASWRTGEQAIAADQLTHALAAADICIVGGEDYPGVRTRRDATDIAAAYPRLVVVDLPAYVAGYAPGEPAVDLLVQARSGLAFEHSASRPLCFAVPFPTFGQVLLAAIGAWSALLERLASGAGQVVVASLQQGAALFPLPLWLAAEQPDAEFGKVTPKDVKHLIFECADGTFVQFVMGVPSATQKLYRVLEIPVEADPEDRGIPKPGTPTSRFFGDLELIGSYVIKKNRPDIIRAAEEAGLPVAPVLEPGEFWDDEQIAANGMLVTRDRITFAGDPIACASVARVAGDDRTARVGSRGARGVLDGVVVLDFGTYVAGPFTSRLLADLGATVIKVEGLAGDPNRGLQRHFLVCQMGKKDIVIDLKSDDGRAVLDKLLASADIVTHNFRVGVAERLGLDPASVRRHSPSAITLHTMSFGPVGPRALAPGFDMVIQAMVGLERRAGGPSQPPLWYRTPYLDYGSGSLGAIAVLMAEYELRTERQAADMWVSLLNTGLFLMSDVVRDAAGTWIGSPRLDEEQLGTHPAERMYQTADGWVAIAARDEEQARTLWSLLVGETPASPRATWDGHTSLRIAEACHNRQTDQLVRLLGAAGVWAAPCTTDGLADMLASSAARDAGWIGSRGDEHYGHLYGPVGALVTLERGSAVISELGGAPARGRHTREILAHLGFRAEQVEELFANGTAK
jgi:crotonobetainyl-CoA:carnitine CoA-transferase CaiB-like acyl-CoA transferase